jgi:hypothetical protein
VVPLCEEEVNAIVDLLDVDCVLVCTMLQDQLFEEEESTLVWDLLPDLDDRSPGIVRVTLLAVCSINLANVYSEQSGDETNLDTVGSSGYIQLQTSAA